MQCKVCNYELNENAIFCPKCGNKVSKEKDSKRDLFSISGISYYKNLANSSAGTMTVMSDRITYKSSFTINFKHNLTFLFKDISNVEIEKVYLAYSGIVIRLYNGEKYGFFFTAAVNNRGEKLTRLYEEIQRVLKNK